MVNYKKLNNILTQRYKFHFYIALVCGFILCLSAFVLALNGDTYNTEIDAVIISVSNDECEEYLVSSKSKYTSVTEKHYRCNITYKFDVNGKTYTNTAESKSKTDYSKKIGETIKVQYNSENPETNRLKTLKKSQLATIVLIVAICLPLCVYIPYLFSKKVKGGATILTVSELIK